MSNGVKAFTFALAISPIVIASIGFVVVAIVQQLQKGGCI